MLATTYHLRSQAGVKVLGGTLSMGAVKFDLNAAADQLTAKLAIVVMPSGRLSYAKDGKPVWVYLSLCPGETEKGKAVLKAHAAARSEAQRVAEERQESQHQALTAAADAIGIENAIALLKKGLT